MKENTPCACWTNVLVPGACRFRIFGCPAYLLTLTHCYKLSYEASFTVPVTTKIPVFAYVTLSAGGAPPARRTRVIYTRRLRPRLRETYLHIIHHLHIYIVYYVHSRNISTWSLSTCRPPISIQRCHQ
jgi:hypothetical protein